MTPDNCSGATPDLDAVNCKCVCFADEPTCAANECCRLNGTPDSCGRPTANIGTLVTYYTLNEAGCKVEHNDGCSFETYPEVTETCTGENECVDGICCKKVTADESKCEYIEKGSDGCPVVENECSEGLECNGAGKCCPKLELPEGATSDACYTATDTDSDGCNDTYVLNCGDFGCKSDYSACCTTPAATDCGNCQKPEIGSDGCYTGACRACTEEENCTYEFGTTGKDSSETAILKCFEDYCFCTEMQLYYCSSGQAAYTICCNPNADPGCSGLGCQPKDFWMNLDASGECINTVSGGPETDPITGLPVVPEV